MHLLNVLEYRSMAKKAISVLIQMPTTYLSKSGFSCLREIKSRKRNSITPIDTLMGEQLKRVSFLSLKCWLIISNNKKHNNFLNLLCALPCVILSADCSAIVFLHVTFNVTCCLISNFRHRVHELVTRFFRVHQSKKG